MPFGNLACRGLPQRLVRLATSDFAVLAAIACGLNALLFFDRDVIPGNDTFQNYTLFHVFYSHLAEHGALPLWLPYCNKGIPSLLWHVAFLSPASEAFMGLGALCGIEDVLTLYKASVFFELLVFLAGLRLCSSRLFADRRTRFLVCLLGCGTIAWHDQIYFCLRIAYLMPTILWCLLRFRDTGRPGWLWTGACTSLVQCVGGPPYFAGPQLLSLGAFLLPLLVAEPRLLRRIVAPTAGSLAGAVVFAGLFVAIDRAVDHSLDDVRHVIAKRTEDGTSRLGDFLSVGTFDWHVVAASYLPGFYRAEQRDPNMYAGAAAWLLCLAACLRRRRVETWCAALPAVLLVAFCFSDAVATAAFRLPLMEYYRYRMHVLSLATFYFVLWSGGGLEALFLAPPRQQIRLVAVASLAIVASTLPGSLYVAAHGVRSRLLLHVPERFAFVAALAVAGLVLLAWSRRPYADASRLRRTAFGVVLVLLLADLGFHQAWVQSNVKRKTPGQEWLYRTRPIPYVPVRSPIPPQARPSGVQYTLQYQWEGLDPCRSALLRETADPEVEELVTDASLASDVKAVVIGCGHPKLVFTNAVEIVPPEARDDALDLVDAHGGRRFVVEDRDLPAGFVPGSDFVALHPSEFSLDHLRCGFEAPADGFLVYSDSAHPDWRATLDGAPVDILVANTAFKAVFVPAGRHEVVFRMGGAARFHANVLFVVGLLATGAMSVPILACLFLPVPQRGGDGDRSAAASVCDDERAQAARTGIDSSADDGPGLRAPDDEALAAAEVPHSRERT